jgi:hypothetical protein
MIFMADSDDDDDSDEEEEEEEEEEEDLADDNQYINLALEGPWALAVKELYKVEVFGELMAKA